MEEKGSRRFGAYLRKLREERRLTLDAIEELSAAHRDRISKTYLSRCENGRTLPSFTKLFTLSKIYKTRLTALAERLELDVELEEMPAIDLSTANYDELTTRGQSEVEHGNLKRAFLLFNAAWDLAALQADTEADTKEAQARLALAIALYRLDRLEMAEDECKNLISMPGVSKYLMRRALVLLSSVYYDLQLSQMAEIMTVRAEKDIDPTDPKSKADIFSMKGLLAFDDGRLDEARKCLGDARTIYEELKDEFNTCKAFGNAGRVEASAGRSDEAIALLSKSLGIAKTLGYQYLVANWLHSIGLVHHTRGRADLAAKHFYESNEISRRAEYHDVTFLNCFYLWKLARSRGDRASAALNEKSLRFFAFKIEKSFPELEEFKSFLEKGKGKP